MPRASADVDVLDAKEHAFKCEHSKTSSIPAAVKPATKRPSGDAANFSSGPTVRPWSTAASASTTHTLSPAATKTCLKTLSCRELCLQLGLEDERSAVNPGPPLRPHQPPTRYCQPPPAPRSIMKALMEHVSIFI